ncbi:3-deoxy-D-manno-octulosonate cytidylyltransferase [Thermovibrio ammonificans HB-1]|uniref:3-deoxy-manno-octulosonate cytidylyltransferase n=1 Tax=Thermovibrio ammonificans (strain DSM 15698 / JCM 12110 / HB-1) TaxID=648996 RepID=E8T6A2_THEA1|nr:3-deoxy-manno-octulosonate cytidylyltransferase [Thermovibrio ammonificans]ADU96686.1 3-deoxy-D-manno-octulosonate cytidylyltransferase [Thermovibrio ammonificans HB-1]
MNRLVVVIPARIGSTRLPRKPLIRLAGKPLIWWVVKRAKLFTDNVLVATDSVEVARVAKEAGARAAMTPSELPSGTDRVYRAVKGIECRFVINLQGDEPLVTPEHLKAVLKGLEAGANFSTVATPFRSAEEVKDPSKVKVVTDSSGFALYFSRSPIPYTRDGEIEPGNYLKHLGIYGYTKEALEKFVNWPVGRLEGLEKLEQLRILENGERIKVELVEKELHGVDTPRDVEKVNKILEKELADGL